MFASSCPGISIPLFKHTKVDILQDSRFTYRGFRWPIKGLLCARRHPGSYEMLQDDARGNVTCTDEITL